MRFIVMDMQYGSAVGKVYHSMITACKDRDAVAEAIDGEWYVGAVNEEATAIVEAIIAGEEE